MGINDPDRINLKHKFINYSTLMHCLEKLKNCHKDFSKIFKFKNVQVLQILM